jgi:ABC-2 type transport system permease protein
MDPLLSIFLRKELRDLRTNPQVIPGYLVLPVIAVVLPTVFLAVTPSGVSPGTDPDIVALFRIATRDPALAAFPESERVARLIVREFSAFFILMPVILASLSAAASIAAEKQQRTLEPLLATPISDRELMIGKLLAALLPGVVVTWAASVLYLVSIAVVTEVRFGQPFVPGLAFAVSVGLLAPLAGTAAALVGMRASIRAVDVQSAVQSASLWVIPAALLLVGLAGRIAVRSVVGGLIGVVIAAGSAWIVFRGNLTRFEREEILTRWR